jgi:hypothetical protein
MSDQHSVALQESIRELIQAYRDVRSVARKHEATLGRALRRLEKGAGVLATFAAMPPEEPRKESLEVLTALEQARHRVRLATMEACLAAGMSIGEFSRRWGFSRQLAARYAKEIRDRRTQHR